VPPRLITLKDPRTMERESCPPIRPGYGSVCPVSKPAEKTASTATVSRFQGWLN
jgi:hypothetical protein